MANASCVMLLCHPCGDDSHFSASCLKKNKHMFLTLHRESTSYTSSTSVLCTCILIKLT